MSRPFATFNHWERKAFVHIWRRILHFEFWPAGIFYLPLIPYYLYLSLKHRTLLAPFFSNPNLENGGLIGESKWDFLKHLESGSTHTLKSLKISPGRRVLVIQTHLQENGFEYPFILKPDVGQRGYGVRIIRGHSDLENYLRLADFEMIAQKLSVLPCEAGLFYIRYPGKHRGFLFSITDKKFPIVVGDGVTPLGALILKDSRARIIASTYFSRHRKNLNQIIPENRSFQLSECGNHCQGAIFLNGESLHTPELEEAIHTIAQKIPHFYFGRFDIRYADAESLKKGRLFEIVEINGAGSEATHIWDPKTRLRDAYRTLFTQWRILFEIGDLIRRDPSIPARVNIRKFLLESLKVYFRNAPLSTSS